MIPFAASRRSGSLCGCSKTVKNTRFSAHWPKSRRSSLQRVPVQPKEDFLVSKNNFFVTNDEFRSWLEPQPHLGFLGRSEPETLNRPERRFNSSQTVENKVFCTLSLWGSDEMPTLRRLRKKWNFASRSSHSTIFAVRPPVQRTQTLTLRSIFSPSPFAKSLKITLEK